jgi:hypothetical protein
VSSSSSKYPVESLGANPSHPQSGLNSPDDLRLRVETLSKGIDNHRVDVQISPAFAFELGQAIKQVLKRVVEVKAPLSPQASVFESLRHTYTNMMLPLIHRVKTDLTPEQIRVLHFAVFKHCLLDVRKRLDELVAEMKASEANLRNSGSPKLLTVHQQMVWLSTNYPAILYSCNQQIFKQLHKVDSTELSKSRKQYLHESLPQLTEILFNPMLWGANLSQEDMLLENFALWGSSENSFSKLNTEWEQQLAEFLEGAAIPNLKTDKKVASDNTALYDELGGLLATQSLLGVADKQTDILHETLSWLEHSENVAPVLHGDADAVGDSSLGWLKARTERKRRKALLKGMTLFLQRDGKMANVVASWQYSKVWNQQLAEHFNPVQVCLLLAGTAPRNLQKRLEEVRSQYPLVAKQMQSAIDHVRKQCTAQAEGSCIRILMEISRFRKQLKYYRFAHRAFNVISLLETKSDIELSKSGSQLYRLYGETETQDTEVRIAHHTILKADVRGSTLVTEELANQGLNPASYFSQRFFDPINNSLGAYGAEKLFIEGDAVILSLTERADKPQQWFAVSRACGLARELIDVIRLKNAYSKRTGLPLLEIGIGISFADHAPVYLYDAGHPIMISAAIGRADRLSSCSWKLKEIYDSGLFNVEVCRIAKDGNDSGEKGQETIRYNVNGILIDDLAFEKLKTEIALKKINLKVGERSEVLYFGRFPDQQEKHRDLVIRAGEMRLWKDGEMVPNTGPVEYFYEIVTQRTILSAVSDKLKGKDITANSD